MTAENSEQKKGKGKTLLAIDDDANILKFIDLILTKQGYTVLKAQDGQEGLRQMYSHRPDLIILDVQMPKMDGWETCQRIREITDVPVVMLTGSAMTEEDIVRGLDCGADDYLTKPVGANELIARIRAMMRRAELSPAVEKSVSYSDSYLTVDLADRLVMIKGERVKLTPKEFRLLAYLLENAGRILTQKQILEAVWGWEWIDDLDSLRIYIWHLRQKIETDPAKPKYVLTEAGVGYRFEKAE
ncbi:response regulator transcription factor [Chloroflexota bacterium]